MVLFICLWWGHIVKRTKSRTHFLLSTLCFIILGVFFWLPQIFYDFSISGVRFYIKCLPILFYKNLKNNSFLTAKFYIYFRFSSFWSILYKMSKACRMLNLDEDGSSTPNTAIIKLGVWFFKFFFYYLYLSTYY